LKKVAALPVSLAFSDQQQNHVTGIFLPFIGGQEIYELYGTRSRLQYFPTAKFNFLIRAAYNLAVAFCELHKAGIIVGDVNEQNIKVLPDATVRFIDCDSFQVTIESKVYTSDVGTPMWTPPELHGITLTGYSRSVNHDLFGLAQLVFLLLFTGRHPFSGRPRSNRQLQPDEAISEYAFAFAPENLGSPLLPPPGCATLSSLPEEIQFLFFRAFLRGSEKPDGRPSAMEWATHLDYLSKNLGSCAHSNHVFWLGTSSCPWCAVVLETGVDMFPPPIGHTLGSAGADIRDNGNLSQFLNVRPHAFFIQHPPVIDGLPPHPLPIEPDGIGSVKLCL
jgi:DNA-binding helix-hairpin-helix protein with protein kinase domain